MRLANVLPWVFTVLFGIALLLTRMQGLPLIASLAGGIATPTVTVTPTVEPLPTAVMAAFGWQQARDLTKSAALRRSELRPVTAGYPFTVECDGAVFQPTTRQWIVACQITWYYQNWNATMQRYDFSLGNAFELSYLLDDRTGRVSLP